MLKYYRPTLIKILKEVHAARLDPYENAIKWRNIQEALIKKLIYTEDKIRSLKQKIKDLNLYRKNPNNRLSKTESVKVKYAIQKAEYQIDEYWRIIDILKSIGDAVAFTFIHKLDIKPQNFKESSGFISEKKGLKNELKMFRYTFKKGGIAILNDLTSVLRYADITLITPDGTKYVEVKSSENTNARTERQRSNAEKLFNYLETDTTEGLYGIEGKMQRVALESNEINYEALLNTLIKKSKSEGSAFQLVEHGVLYFVSHSDVPAPDDMGMAFKSNNIEKPSAFMLNTMKFTEQGFYPFSLSINDPEDYLDFLEGVFTIIMFIDIGIVDSIAKQNRFELQEPTDPRFMFSFKNKRKNPALSEFNVSIHYFHRVIIEFVSLRWLLEAAFKRFIKLKL